MSESFTLGVIEFFFQYLAGPSVLAVIGIWMKRKFDKQQTAIEDTKREITNSHPEHLRDDLDRKFALSYAKQDTLVDMVSALEAKVDRQNYDISVLYDTATDHEKRLTGQARVIREHRSSQ